MTPEARASILLATEALAEALIAAVESAETPDTPDRLYSVEEATAIINVGRSAIYQELASGRLRSIKVGARRLIPASALRERIAR